MRRFQPDAGELHREREDADPAETCFAVDKVVVIGGTERRIEQFGGEAGAGNNAGFEKVRRFRRVDSVERIISGADHKGKDAREGYATHIPPYLGSAVAVFIFDDFAHHVHHGIPVPAIAHIVGEGETCL